MNLLGMSPINKAKMAGLDPQLLGLLNQAPALAAQLGTVAPPPKPLSKFQQLKDRFFQAPQGMEGLLGGDDLNQAQNQGLLSLGASLLADSGPRTADKRVGVMESVGRGVQAAQGGYREALQNAMQMRGAAQQFETGKTELEGKRLGLEKAKGLDAGRQAIIKRNPMPKDDVNKMRDWIDATLPSFIEIGDDETVARLSEIRKTLGDKTRTHLNQVDLGDRIQLTDDAGNIIREVPKGAVPKAPGNTDAQANIEFQRSFGREARLASDYEKATADKRDAHAFVAGAMNNVGAAKAGDGAAQVELLYAFIRSLDPNTAVREGEVQLARDATPLWDWAKANLSKVENKSVTVTPQMVDNMAALMKKRMKGYERFIKDKRNYYIKRAGRARIPDADSVFDVVPSWVDPDEAFPEQK